MNRPWIAEQTVDEARARALITAQFPELAPVRLQSFGAGWDNTAFLVNETWIFRFPRRQMAVPLFEMECRILPGLSRRLPLPIPNPTKVGRPSNDYPWPFAGYSMLAGRTACVADLDDKQRLRSAEPLARFLAVLHAVPTEEAMQLGARPDTLNRLGVAARSPRLRQWLGEIAHLGLEKIVDALHHVIEAAAQTRPASGATLVHGDLYARHLLVDAAAVLCGVIDWGDIHLGDPAVDLSLVCGFLPGPARQKFQAAYGPITEETWRLARFKAVQTSVAIVSFAHETEDAALLREGKRALHHVAAAVTG